MRHRQKTKDSEKQRARESERQTGRERQRERDYLTVAAILNHFKFTDSSRPLHSAVRLVSELKADSVIWTQGHVEAQQVSW